MLSELAFFSLIRLTDPSQRRAYNRWHQLDHRPENLALPGVLWGDRWWHPEEDIALGAPEYASFSSLAMYWFGSPVERAVREWDALGEASFQWGRGPLLPGVERPMLAFFRPVKGYSAPRALVDPDVLPYRPHRGLHLTVTEVDDPHAPEVHASYAEEDRETIPRILELDGVAGAWTFSFSHPQRHSSLPFEGTAQRPPGSMRIRLVYLESDPVETAAGIRETDERSGVHSPGRRVVLDAPVRTIIPWQDW